MKDVDDCLRVVACSFDRGSEQACGGTAVGDRLENRDQDDDASVPPGQPDQSPQRMSAPKCPKGVLARAILVATRRLISAFSGSSSAMIPA